MYCLRTSHTNLGEDIYKQSKGGPIGCRLTMACARLVMADWEEGYKIILESSKIWIGLLAGYVDDGRQLTGVLELGMRFSKEENKFIYSTKAEKEDREIGDDDDERMARVCLPAMNSINQDLVFTVETAKDFEDKRLATIDFRFWTTLGVIYTTHITKSQ